MTIIFATLAILWWIAIWGIFEIITQDYTDNEKLKLYFIMLGFVIIIFCFFPKFIDHL